MEKYWLIPNQLTLLFAFIILLTTVQTFPLSAKSYSFHTYLTQHQTLRPEKKEFNVKDFGAQGDGETIDTKAINKAIKAASEHGGGKVYIPAGTYLSGSIHLKSNITIYLGSGSVIKASTNPDDFDEPEENPYSAYQDFGHSHWHNSLLWGEDIENLTIEGPGQLYGEGLVTGRKDDNDKDYGDKTIALKNSHNVTLRDFSILHGGHLAILATGVDNLTIDNILVDSNRDGVNIDATKNVKISNSSFNTPWNDAICLKSSYALGEAKPTEDVTITNCMVSGGYKEGSLIDGSFKPIGSDSDRTNGRIKFGTESNGGFKNVTIDNIVFKHSRGLALTTVDGGDLEDVTISNITMEDIVNAPIFLRIGARMRGPEEIKDAGHLRRVNFSNIVASGVANKTGSVIAGISNHPIENISFNNIRFVYKGGGNSREAEIPGERTKEYPEPDSFGILPSYGFFIRHAEELDFNNIHLTYEEDEERAPFFLDSVNKIYFNFIEAKHIGDNNQFFLNNAKNIFLFRTGKYSEKNITERVRDSL